METCYTSGMSPSYHRGIFSHPSAEEVAKRAKQIIKSKSLVQSLGYVSCSRQDVEAHYKSSKDSLMFRNRLRSGDTFLDHHDSWVLDKFIYLPKEIDVFCYYTSILGVPLHITGLYNTRIEVQWLTGRTTEEPSTWLQMVETEGMLPRKLYYGDGFRYEV